MTEKTTRLRNGIFCVLVFLACFWLAWPVAQMPLSDDFSYIRSAQVFAQTGHIVYNGWATPILGWMIPWGALFIKVFGFSFMAVKLSTLPFAVSTLLLFHAILRRFEIGARNAVIGTLILGLSPIFLPLSAGFLTDIPGLFVIVLCLYCCQRAALAGSAGAAIGWLAVAAGTNVVGGTARQIAWLGVLVMVPCTGWLLRKRRGVLAAGLVLWAAGGGAVFCCMRWFAQQPYSIPTRILPDLSWSPGHDLTLAFSTVYFSAAEVLFLLFSIFPVLAAWLPNLSLGKNWERYVALFCVAVLPLLAARVLVGHYGMLWFPRVAFTRISILSHFFGSAGDGLILMLSSVVLAGAFSCVVAVRGRCWAQIVSFDSDRSGRLFWLLVPYSFCYLAFLLPLTWQGMVWSKYVLGVMPCAILGIIWLYERCIGPRLPSICIGLLIVFSAFTVAGVHNKFARQRAKLRAIRELRDAGVPRTRVEGGYPYDGWTQIEDDGHINDPRIRIPKGAYRPQPKRSAHDIGCNEWFLDWVPDVHPAYFIGSAPTGCFGSTGFLPTHYTAWLPPFQRTIEVQRVPGA